MQVNVEEVRLTLRTTNDVVLPDLLRECASHLSSLTR
jgi:hypothetical protein